MRRFLGAHRTPPEPDWASLPLLCPELPSVVIVGGENITAPFLQPVTLRCAGTGVPTPSLRWWKDGVALAASGGSLQVCARAPGLVGQLHRWSGCFLGSWRAQDGPWQPEGRTNNVHLSWKCSVDTGVLGLKKEGSP